MIHSVIVHRGKSFPAYLGDFVSQFYLFNAEAPLTLICDSKFPELTELVEEFPCFKVQLSAELMPTKRHRFFSRWNRMNASFREGFWRFAVERFFLLDDFMASGKADAVLHFEYDNPIYFSVERLEESFFLTSKGISLPPDSVVRCIPSVVFVKSPEAIADFCRSYNVLFLVRKMNDMKAFHHYARLHPDRCSFLPVLPPSYKEGRKELSSESGLRSRRFSRFDGDFEAFGGIFDAAAFGQYLGGVDPRNDPKLGPGYINETAMYSPLDMPLRWERDSAQRWIPMVEHRGRSFPLFNLHIHSKALKRFRSDRKEA